MLFNKFFIHADSTHSISLIKDFKIIKPIYAQKSKIYFYFTFFGVQ